MDAGTGGDVVTGRWLAAFAAVDIAALLPWRPRRTSVYASFGPHPVLSQNWLECEDHGFAGFVSVLEPGCGCTPTGGA